MSNSGDIRSDEGLVDDFLHGDETAFTKLVKRHKQRVIQLVSRLTDNHEEIKDISQEIFIKVYQNLRGFRKLASFRTWLYRIVTNECIDFLRKKKIHSIPLSDVEDEIRSEKSNTGMEQDEMRRFVHSALQQLSPADRMVITLLELEEKTIQEVSEITGWSKVNVKVRAFRARKKLRKILEVYNV